MPHKSSTNYLLMILQQDVYVTLAIAHTEDKY
jgi:hypothetical protein